MSVQATKFFVRVSRMSVQATKFFVRASRTSVRATKFFVRVSRTSVQGAKFSVRLSRQFERMIDFFAQLFRHSARTKNSSSSLSDQNISLSCPLSSSCPSFSFVHSLEAHWKLRCEMRVLFPEVKPHDKGQPAGTKKRNSVLGGRSSPRNVSQPDQVAGSSKETIRFPPIPEA